MKSFLKLILNFLVSYRAVVMLILVRGTGPNVSLYKSILDHLLIINKNSVPSISANSHNFVTF